MRARTLVSPELDLAGCPPSSSEDDLRKLFEEHGKVEEVFIMRGGSRSGMACAFVRYTTREMAQAAIEGIHGQHRLPDATEPLVVRWADAPGSRKRDAREANKRRGGAAGAAGGGKGRGTVGGSQMGNFYCGMNYAALNLAMQQMMMQQQQQQGGMGGMGGMGGGMGAMPGAMPFFQPQYPGMPPSGNFSGGTMPPQMMGCTCRTLVHASNPHKSPNAICCTAASALLPLRWLTTPVPPVVLCAGSCAPDDRHDAARHAWGSWLAEWPLDGIRAALAFASTAAGTSSRLPPRPHAASSHLCSRVPPDLPMPRT